MYCANNCSCRTSIKRHRIHKAAAFRNQAEACRAIRLVVQATRQAVVVALAHHRFHNRSRHPHTRHNNRRTAVNNRWCARGRICWCMQLHSPAYETSTRILLQGYPPSTAPAYPNQNAYPSAGAPSYPQAQPSYGAPPPPQHQFYGQHQHYPQATPQHNGTLVVMRFSFFWMGFISWLFLVLL